MKIDNASRNITNIIITFQMKIHKLITENENKGIFNEVAELKQFRKQFPRIEVNVDSRSKYGINIAKRLEEVEKTPNSQKPNNVGKI